MESLKKLGDDLLLQHDYEEAIRHYVRSAVSEGLDADLFYLNLTFARRRFRSARRSQPLKVGVCGWELSHNAAGRVRTLADIWSGIAEAEIIGATFDRWGDSLWPPIQNGSIPVHKIHVDDDRQFPSQALDLVLAHPYDVVHLSKPRMPNILFGLLYRLVWDAQVILDIDDEELGVFKAETALSLEELKEKLGGGLTWDKLPLADWTRAAVGMSDCFDSATVSNPGLQAKYGGVVLPHARPVDWSEKAAAARQKGRAELGIGPDKKVILFFGTPRKHKGLVETANSIAALRRDDLCYLVVGDFPDPKLKQELEAVEGLDLRFLPNQPYDRIPEIVALGDACVLLQNDTSLLGRYQVPAKLIDALSANLLVFAQPTSGLMEFIERGAVVPTNPDLLKGTLTRWLADEASADKIRKAGQEFFQAELTVETCRTRLAGLIDRDRRLSAPGVLLENPKQQDLLGRLGGWQIFAPAPKLPAEPVSPAIGAAVPLPGNARIVVYSVLIGAYESVKEPEVLDANARYILFTDNPALKSDAWEIVLLDTQGLSPRRASRLPKMLPHRYLPEHDVSVYLDASLTLVEPDVRSMISDALQGLDIAAYPHFERGCVYDEIDECLALGKAGRARSEAFRKRLEKEQFPRQWGLLENAFLVRRDSPAMRHVNELWFKEYMAGPERDQFSLMYVLWRAEIPHAVIQNARSFRKSPHVRWKKHEGATACGTHPQIEDVRQRFEFLKESDPAALVSTVKAAVERMQAESDADGCPGVSTRQMGYAIEAVTSLEFQALDQAQECRNLLSQALFPTASPFSTLTEVKLAYIPNSAMPTDAANNVHVMKMCAAFAATGTDVVLYSERDQKYEGDGGADLHQRFGTRTSFPIVLMEKDARGRENLLYRLVRRAIEDGCTHIYTRSLEVAVYAAIADVPVIFEEHKLKGETEFAYLSFLARSPALEKIVVISKPLRAALAPVLRDLEGKAVVLHDAADPVTHQPPAFDLGPFQKEGANVGYVGHLYPGKGAEICLELARRMPHVAFHMLGGKLEDIAAWQKEAGELQNLIFHGHRPHAEVAGFIDSLDVCIAPFLRNVGVSGGKYNVADFFSPLKIFEYMAHAKPILTSDLPVLREVLSDGETAVMCDPDDPSSFAAALERLVADKGARERIGRAAKAHFEANYTWGGRARTVRELLEAARPKIDPPPPPGPRLVQHADSQTKPLMQWFYGGEKQAGWAYGINARRLSSRIPSLDHVAPGAKSAADRPLDLALAFDILIMQGQRFQNSGATRKVLRVGGPNPIKVFSGGNARLLQEVLAGVDAVIALSPQLRDYLAPLHPSVHFIPNGIDTAAFTPQRRHRSAGQPFTVGMSASMSKEAQRHIKGYYFAKQACERAGVDLLMIGRGIRQIPHDQLLGEFWSKIDVLLHPVGAGKEASSNVIMEALAMGVPVITTRHAGFHGVALEHGKNGLIMRRTVADFVEAITALKTDPHLCQTLVAEGRAFVERYHALDVVAREYEDVFWKCLRK